MDSVRHAERAADLVNARIEDAGSVRRFVSDRAWPIDQVVERDAAALRRFQGELRPVFEASHEGNERAAVERLNALLAKHPVTPCIAGTGPGEWHLHVADGSSSAAELLVAESLMGLATVACELGASRLGVCDAAPCDEVFVDISPNRSRRYCCDRCSSRANVAAYRARRRAQDAVS